ncbi:MAG: hypothetical protein ACXWUG_13555 [Polyangiales bacterium]
MDATPESAVDTSDDSHADASAEVTSDVVDALDAGWCRTESPAVEPTDSGPANCFYTSGLIHREFHCPTGTLCFEGSCIASKEQLLGNCTFFACGDITCVLGLCVTGTGGSLVCTSGST